MRSYSDITLKYLKKNNKRSIFTVIGIILSLALISGVGFLGLSFRDFMYDRAIKGNGDYEFGLHDIDKRVVSILRNDVDLDKVGVSANEGSGSYKIEEYEEIEIFISSEDETALNEVFNHELTEGRLPKESSELIIDSRAKEILGLSINDKIQFEEITYNNGEEVRSNKFKEYTIVGFEKESYISDGSWFNGITYLDEIKSNKSYDIRFTVKDSKNKRETAMSKLNRLNLDENKMYSNNDLLSLRGQTEYAGVNTAINGVIVFVIGIIIAATVFLVYNSINISVAERMTEFGILRSIGATPKQVSKLVIRESLVLCLMSIPFGVISGFIGVWTTVKLLESKITIMFGDGEGILAVKFYPSIILFTAIIGIVTIFISAFGPAKKSGKVSPINIIKGNTNSEKIKYYNGKIIRKIFGVEGWVAYKNIRKNSKRFIVTILSLSISLIMFITFTTLNMKRIAEMNYINKSSITHGEIYANIENSSEIEEALNKVEGIGEKFVQARTGVSVLALDMNLISNEFKEKFSYESDEFINNVEIRGYDDNSLKEMGINDALKENEVILVNSRTLYDENGKLSSIDITKLKEGDTFKVPTSNFNGFGNEDYAEILLKDKEEESCIEFKVKKVIDKNPFEQGYNHNFTIIMGYDNYEKVTKDLYLNKLIKFKYSDINNEKLTDEASKEVREIADKYFTSFSDLNEDNKMQQQMWNVINVFVYGFIVMVTLIGVVNVINTISLNILLKKKEFGTLGTIGMSRMQLTKMVLLEGILHGIFSSIIGGILSTGLVLIALKIVDFGFTVSNKIYWQPFVIGFAINLVVVIIASLIPLRKLRKMSLVETIRNIE
ncbi:ABC transporter permease [Clostridium saudiense]|uniref:ABC transporter permease n=1 Tax=Clostridium saudiense TaxID=1414720 RepID=UPI000821F0A8|nr:ABC transporter permease [Clostridium saudiense]MDU7454646.1 FtsX-like permease family protein [Clostridium saudiense]SCJ53343.1 acidobacterial duplicated orphan permease [uncultured Clostridium sp.]